MAVKTDTFFGGTLAFGTSTVLSIEILSGSRTGMSIVDINTSTTITTGDSHTYIPGDLIEGGSYQFDVLYDPDDDMDALMGISQTITITYAVHSSKSTAVRKVFTGWINSFDEQLPLEDKLTASLGIKVASDVTHTAST